MNKARRRPHRQTHAPGAPKKMISISLPALLISFDGQALPMLSVNQAESQQSIYPRRCAAPPPSANAGRARVLRGGVKADDTGGGDGLGQPCFTGTCYAHPMIRRINTPSISASSRSGSSTPPDHAEDRCCCSEQRVRPAPTRRVAGRTSHGRTITTDGAENAELRPGRPESLLAA